MTEHYEGGGDKTVAKLVILRKYIWAYLQILHWADTWYIGTHAGTGKTYLDRSEVSVKGSALRALEHDFDRYIFYEINSDSFETLVETIEEDQEIQMKRGYDEDDIRMAHHRARGIFVYNMDCNDGVESLIENKSESTHWFVFIDPEKVSSSKGRLLRRLINRGNTDILYNFQTTGVERNASENASHSHESLTEMFDFSGWPEDADGDEQVRVFKEEIFEDNGYDTVSKKLVSTGENNWRYDLIFGSGADVAERVMDDIMSGNPEQEVKEEIVEARQQADVEQEGLEDFSVSIRDHEQSLRDDEQSGLGEFT